MDIRPIYKFINKFLTYLIRIIGFSALCFLEQCHKYGAPYADFLINGNVKNQETSSAIPDIKINLEKKNRYYPHDSTLSDNNGNFTFRLHASYQKDTFSLRLTDTDSSANGSFENKDTTVTFTGSNFTGGDGYYEGAETRNIEIKLKPKK